MIHRVPSSSSILSLFVCKFVKSMHWETKMAVTFSFLPLIFVNLGDMTGCHNWSKPVKFQTADVRALGTRQIYSLLKITSRLKWSQLSCSLNPYQFGNLLCFTSEMYLLIPFGSAPRTSWRKSSWFILEFVMFLNSVHSPDSEYTFVDNLWRSRLYTMKPGSNWNTLVFKVPQKSICCFTFTIDLKKACLQIESRHVWSTIMESLNNWVGRGL